MKTAIVLALCLTMVGCSDATLTTVSKGINDYSVAIHGVSTTVLTANAQGVLTAQEALPVVQLLQILNDAGAQASTLTRNLTKLPTASKSQLLQILQPVIVALQTAVSSNLVGISNQTVKGNILAGLNTALLALNVIAPLLATPANKSSKKIVYRGVYWAHNWGEATVSAEVK